MYADSAYASVRHDDLLKQQNKRLSSIRSTVERVFGMLKRHYGRGRASDLGKARNHTH